MQKKSSLFTDLFADNVKTGHRARMKNRERLPNCEASTVYFDTVTKSKSIISLISFLLQSFVPLLSTLLKLINSPVLICLS